MAVFVPGTSCPLCEKPMTVAGEVIMFSPFVADRSDPLFVFSDAAVHAACFARHPLSEQAKKWHDEAARNRNVNERVCAACGTSILNPDEYFGTGLLSRDAADPLFEFNFIHLHRSHALSWKRFDEFRRRMETAHTAGAWQGPRLAFGTARADDVRWIV